MSDIEARLVLRAQLGEAVKALGELQRDLKQIATEAGLVGKAASTGVGQVGQAAKEAATAQTEAAREVTQAEAAEAAKQAAIEAEAAARRKAAAAEAAREAKAKTKAEQQAAKDAADAQKKIRDAAEKDARESANRSRMLGPQLTDIVVGLSTGQSPFTVLLQQGGQLKDLFGGIGNAAKALASVFTPVRLVIGGIAAVLGTLAYQAVQAYRETDTLNKSLALTGNVAETSAGKIDATAKTMADRAKTSVANAREALSAAAASGNFIGASYESAARAALALSKLTGQTSEEEIKNFGDMSAGVADSAAKLNKSYHFLTLADYERIASMEAAGQKQEAMRELLDKLADTMEKRAKPAVTGFALGWQNLKRDVSDVVDWFRVANKELGTSTAATEAEIAEQKRYIAEKQSKGLDTAGAEQYLRTLQDQLAQIKANAAAQSKTAEQRQVDRDVELRNDKGYQDALSQTAQAGLRERVAAQEAALEARRAAVERFNANGLLTEQQYAAQIAAIDAAGVSVRIKQLEDLQALEAKRQFITPAEQEAQRARLIDLSAQIREQRSQLQQVQSRGRATVDAKNLEEARRDADEWAKAWTSAADQVRSLSEQNAETAAQRLRDPLQRAEAEAKVRIAGIKKQLEDLARDVQLKIDITVDPAQKKLLKDQLEALSREGKQAIDEQYRSATFDSLRRQATEQLEAVRVKQDELTQQERTGALTTLQAEQQKRDAREAAVPVLETILKALDAIKASAADTTAVDALRNSIEDLKVRANDLDQLARRTLAQGFSTFFEDVATGAERADKAALKFLANVAKAALNLVAQNLGQQLADSLIPKGGTGGLFKSFGSFILDSFGTFTLHSGGVVGVDGAARTAPLSAFLGAPRYHSGGIAGLRPNEVPAILEAGEEVLRADSPRHRNNFQAGVSVGDVNVSVSVQGGDGSTNGQALGQRLGDALKSKVYEVLAEESREGGMLAGRGA